MKMLLAVALGGAIGAVARYGVGVWTGRVLGHGFPWATIIVNITGSLILGFLISYMALRTQFPAEWRAFLAVGVLGAFTTFSTFSLDATTLMQRGAIGSAVFYVLMSVPGAILTFWGGQRLGRILFG
ncbi:MAG: fluoride efflux transporter CrcB [Rhodospirillaceae bacterium]|nr:fluoride efflux transporter CrcB [Rhodospirillaceae bacterium]